jgi:hypothetical protein
LFSDLHKININSYGTLCHNSRARKKTLSKDLETKRKVTSFVKVKEGTSDAYWNEKREVYLLTNMHNLPASSHFTGEEGIHQNLCALVVIKRVWVLWM